MSPTRLRAWRFFTVSALLFAALTLGVPLAADQLTVVSFGGSYARASQQAYHEPFTAETGIEVRLETTMAASPRSARRWRPATCTGTWST